MKRLIFILIETLITTLLFAAPAKRNTFVATQKDGTKITLMFVGDEHMHYYINTETKEKMLRGADGDFYVISESTFEEHKQIADSKRAQANNTRKERLEARRKAASNTGMRKASSAGSIFKGKKKGIIILVDFADVKFDASHTQQELSDIYNKVGYNKNGHIGSVHDYFYDQSYGKFDLTFDVVGPVTLSHEMSYYGGNDSSGDDLRPGEMVKEACLLADKSVNFKDYTWTNALEVDQVFIIFAGYGENFWDADPNTVWPHQWDLRSTTGSSIKLDGVKIDTYACSSELYGTSGVRMDGIGTFCHEFSHCLGLPDLYDTEYNGGLGMSNWDLMDSGNYNGPNAMGEVPAGYSAYERYCLDWLEPIDILDGGTTIKNMPALNEQEYAYIFFNGNDLNDYCFLENRKADKWFKYFSFKEAGEGLFVTHIRYNKSLWDSNKINNNPKDQHMTWIAPDGDYNSSTGAFFPSAKTNSLNIISHELSNITKNPDGTISFLFDVGGESDPTDSPEPETPTILTLTETIKEMLNGNKNINDVEKIVEELLGK